MQKITNDVKQYYLDNPEMLEMRICTAMENLEDYLQKYERMDIAKQCFDRWEKMWANAKSYWIFPDIEDMHKLVDEEYKKL